MSMHDQPFAMTPSWPELRKYTDRNPRPSQNNIHDGQLKLRLGEIFFFAQCVRDGLVNVSEQVTVVYVGAGPGTHLVEMVEHMSNWHFHLYDPTPFDENLKRFENVKLFSQLFGYDDARFYAAKAKNSKILFVCDMRSKVHSRVGHDQRDIDTDMRRQEEWVRMIRPAASWLKFRFPFPTNGNYKKDDTYKYLKGTVFLQAFAPANSTETRLYVVNSNARELVTCMYNLLQYEEQLCHFNNVERPQHNYDKLIAAHALKMFNDYVQSPLRGAHDSRQVQAVRLDQKASMHPFSAAQAVAINPYVICLK